MYSTSVPCGKCYACLSTKRNVWTFRLQKELRVAESAHFVTLTYDDQNVPIIKTKEGKLKQTLRKEDLTSFIKALRSHITRDRKVPNRFLKKSEKTHKTSPKIRYFACGEYGGRTNRPHYHIILFNCPIHYFKNSPIDAKMWSNTIEDIWHKGNVDIGKVENGSIHYVTKYHMFPITLQWSERDERQRPFATMSKKPGIGGDYINEEIKKYFKDSKAYYNTTTSGHKVPLGRYYKEKIFEDEIEKRKAQKKAVEIGKKQQISEENVFSDYRDYLANQRTVHVEGNKKVLRQSKKSGKL